MHWDVEEQISEGTKVVTRLVWTGTNAGSFAGTPASGKSVRVKGVVIDEVENGVLVRGRILNDELGMLQQLGVLPVTPDQP